MMLEVDSDCTLMEILQAYGETPLPPYIKREEGPTVEDKEAYQTVYAQNDGAIAAPTAGLHFTLELLRELAQRGIANTAITLHVGVGTFRPVAADLIDEHIMEEERFVISERAARLINETRAQGGRVIAVGTTTVRTLEAVAAQRGRVVPCSGRTNLFIRPPYQFKVVDALLTNFHLPRSTLLMMVAALMGREVLGRAYQEAIQTRYRFYSYGDSMLIL
jgi:S-adenosylmethionine:tRNA ribosyltransferase-isomerase